MGFPSPATDYIEQRLSLDQLLIQRHAATYFMPSENSYLQAGIMQGALLVIDSAATACDGSVVICSISGEYCLRRLRLYPTRCLESLSGDGRREQINQEADDSDAVFGVVIHAINDMRTHEFDDTPII